MFDMRVSFLEKLWRFPRKAFNIWQHQNYFKREDSIELFNTYLFLLQRVICKCVCPHQRPLYVKYVPLTIAEWCSLWVQWVLWIHTEHNHLLWSFDVEINRRQAYTFTKASKWTTLFYVNVTCALSGNFHIHNNDTLVNHIILW